MGSECFSLNICYFSWKTAERLFLDAMEKIKAIGNEVTADFILLKMSKFKEHLPNNGMSPQKVSNDILSAVCLLT